MQQPARIQWPEGKRFAFTVFDDTDLATLDNVRPVYDLLAELGMRTTKSVWPIDGKGVARIGGSTCDDPAYAAWTVELQQQGFEIGLHGASGTTSQRADTIRGLDRFRELYGHAPATYANHSGNEECLYWGPDRVSGTARLAYRAMTRFRNDDRFRGHREGDPLFWGDLCKAQIRYVRNFTFTDIDTLAQCPQLPYHDPTRPYVGAWFASSEGANLRSYTACLSEANQDRLAEAGGACIMYTHFAAGFVEGGRLDDRFVALMRRLAGMGGWYVPVVTLLDHIAAQQGVTTLDARGRRALEWRWLRGKMRTGHT